MDKKTDEEYKNIVNKENFFNVKKFFYLNCSKCRTSLSGVCVTHSKEKNNMIKEIIINNSIKNRNFNSKTYISVSMSNSNYTDNKFNHNDSCYNNSFPISSNNLNITKTFDKFGTYHSYKPSFIDNYEKYFKNIPTNDNIVLAIEHNESTDDYFFQDINNNYEIVDEKYIPTNSNKDVSSIEFNFEDLFNE